MKKIAQMFAVLAAAVVLASCGGGGSDGDGGGATVTGNVTSFQASVNADIAGVGVSVGTNSTTTAGDGVFTLTNVPTGNQTVTFSQSGSSADFSLNDIGDEETFTLSDVQISGSDIVTALTGTWIGQIYSSDIGLTLDMTMTIAPNTNVITGTASNEIGDEWSIEGIENGTTATGTAEVTGGPCVGDSAIWEGTFDGTTISGTYSSGGGVCNASEGNFSLTKQ